MLDTENVIQMYHTPGPWELKDGHVISTTAFDTTFGANDPKEGTRKNAVICFLGKMDEEEKAANTALILAAPELLEAAKAMDILMEHLWDVVPWGNASGLDTENLSSVPKQLKETIAKAQAEIEFSTNIE